MKIKEWMKLKADLEKCTACPDLVTSRKIYPYGKPVIGRGNTSAPIMIIGQCPGRFGAGVTGKPFTKDRSGVLFKKMLEYAGLSRSAVYVSNLVHCCPLDNRTPTYTEVMNCQKWLLKEIDLVKPMFIITLGKMATGAAQRLHLHKYAQIYSLYHPAFILRKLNLKEEYLNDFKLIVNEIKKQLPTRTLEEFM